MQQSISQRTLLFLLASIGLITLPHAFHVPAPIFAFFAILLVWRFLGVWYPAYLPNQMLVFFVITEWHQLAGHHASGYFWTGCRHRSFYSCIRAEITGNKNCARYLPDYLSGFYSCRLSVSVFTEYPDDSLYIVSLC